LFLALHNRSAAQGVDVNSVTNSGIGSGTTGGGTKLTNILNPTAGGNKVTPGGGAVAKAIHDNPVSKAINDTIDKVKDAVSGGNNDGGSGEGASNGTP